MYKLYELFGDYQYMETTEKNKEPAVALMYFIIMVVVLALGQL